MVFNFTSTFNISKNIQITCKTSYTYTVLVFLGLVFPWIKCSMEEGNLLKWVDGWINGWKGGLSQ